MAKAMEVRSRWKRRNICLGVTGAVIVVLALVLVILALTVFKAKKPVIDIDSVTLKDMGVSLDIARLRVNLNLTLDVDLTVENPNKVGFKYGNSSALINYRGQQVGEVPIGAGKISADESKPMNVTVTVMADRFLSNSQLLSDVQGGTLPLSAYAKISGKVSIFKLFKVHVDSYTTCDVSVFISNRTIGEQKCRYKTKF